MAPDPETRLFQAIISQAFADAVQSPIRFRMPKRPKRRCKGQRVGYERRRLLFRGRVADVKNAMRVREKEIAEARKWLLSDSKDFRFVVSYSGMDYDYLIGHARMLERLGWPDLSAPTTLAA